MCIYNRLKKIQQCVKEEENACQVLAAVSVHALCRSFDVAVENKLGVNLELIYNEISREEREKEQLKKQRKNKKKKKRSDKEKKQASGNKDDDEQDSYSCDPMLVPDKCDCSCNDDVPSEDDEEKLILCDGTIIDAVDFISPSMNISDLHHDEKIHSRSASIENLEMKTDTLSITSCHSCHNNDGQCAQRSIDAGYSSETQHEVLLSCNNNSRTSSIVSSPEGSDACSHNCCDDKHTDDPDTAFLTLEQMLVSFFI
jgi:hypothetical protein